MIKYYKVIKEHPLFDVGAILESQYDSDSYSPTDTIFVKEPFDKYEGWTEGSHLVEDCPEWFERVYPISDLKKKLFGTRAQAKAAAAALYEESK